MTQWLKTLTSCLCILTVLVHLVPKGKFSRYVRFYGSLLFLLAAAGPLWRILAGEGELERLLQLEFLREDHYDLETSMSGMADLKNEQIMAAYQKELTRQIRETAAAYNVTALGIRLSFDAEEEYRLTGITFGVQPETREENAAGLDSLRRELTEVFALDPDQIRVR